MSRPKTFDRDAVLDKAVMTFWARGYEATSLQDLINAMGVQRQSVYDTFGDKHRLFIAALERYRETVIRPNLEALETTGSPLAALRLFFQDRVDHLIDGGELRGCLITNSVTERALIDGETSETAATTLRLMKSAFHNALQRAQQAGEIPAESDPQGLATYLLNCVQGLFVLGKIRTERRELEQIVALTFALLERKR